MKLKLQLTEVPKIQVIQAQSLESPRQTLDNESQRSNKRRNENSKIFGEYKPKRSVSPHISNDVDQIHLKRSTVIGRGTTNLRNGENFSNSFTVFTEEKERDVITDELVKFKNQKRNNGIELRNKPNGPTI